MSVALSSRVPDGWRTWATRTTGSLVIAIVALVLGVLSAANAPLAVAAAIVVLVVGLAFLDLGLFPVLTFPAALVMFRVGGFLSVADVVLAGATVVALVLVSASEMRPMQPLIWAGVAYLGSLLPTLALNRYAANYVEFAHEAVLVLGSLVVGFVIGRQGRARAALSTYVILCSLVGIAAGFTALHSLATEGKFVPVYLPLMHKNFIGTTLAFALVIAYARPRWVGWSTRWANVAVGLCAVGIAGSQARQAVIGAAVGIVVITLRGRVDTSKRSRLIWFAIIPATLFVINAVINQLNSDNPYNSSDQRLMWFARSIDIWHVSPVFGVGLRWWYTPRFSEGFQPPNAEFEMLTSAGLVGLAGFLAMFSVAVWVLAKMDPVYGTVALAVVLTRFTQAQFDLYWIAAHASVLWLVAGIAFGVQCLEQQGVPPPARKNSAAPSVGADMSRRRVSGARSAVPVRTGAVSDPT